MCTCLYLLVRLPCVCMCACLTRTKLCLSSFHSAMGFMIGAEVADALGSWRWALRISPPS